MNNVYLELRMHFSEVHLQLMAEVPRGHKGSTVASSAILPPYFVRTALNNTRAWRKQHLADGRYDLRGFFI